MNSEPVAWIEAVKLVVNATIVWIVVMGIFPMTPEQQGATLTLALAVVSAIGAWQQRSRVTPTNAPRDSDGTPLVRKA